MTWAWAACAAVYGAVAGVLLPRSVHRLAVEPGLPRRGACPAGHPYEGACRGWLGRGWCRGCARVYGPRAGPVAVVAALVCAAVAVAVGPRPELVVWLAVVPVGVVLAAVDWRVQRLPDVLTLPLAVATPLLLGVAALLPGAGGDWPRALLGGVTLAGAYFVLFLAHPSGLGFGDVKLALTLGVALGWYGWGVLLAGAFLGFLLVAAYGGVLILLGRADRRTAVPFGPFMVLGALPAVLLGGLAAAGVPGVAG